MGLTEAADYTSWSQESLVNRISELERRLKETTTGAQQALNTIPISTRPKNPRASRVFDPSKYNTRLIALKFAYLGANYNGYEHHANNLTKLPAVEEELWKALMKARLIFPTPRDGVVEEQVNWEGCEYSKCGRTDRGVSAFGQVVGIRVRSNRPKKPQSEVMIGEAEEDGSSSPQEPDDSKKTFDPIKDELPYPQILNRLLPPDIRVLAWCPNPPVDFSARFSCRERRYRYFFTQPAFPPTTGERPSPGGSSNLPEGHLDIQAMQAGCRALLGLHDFRNFCKIDGSKQLTNFERRIFRAEIEEVSTPAGASFPAPYAFKPAIPTNDREPALPTNDREPDTPTVKLYCLTLHGSAFLWHQVRHIVAVLFLIGQGLEAPTLIPRLLDVEAEPLRPSYLMADETPLVLWDCIFPTPEAVEARDHDVLSSESLHTGYEDALDWIYVGDEPGREPGGGAKPPSTRNSKWGVGGLVEDVWRVWHGAKMAEILAGGLLGEVSRQGTPLADSNGTVPESATNDGRPRGQLLYFGGDAARISGKYVPVLQKERLESVEVINEKYRIRKGIPAPDPVADRELGHGDE